MPNSSPHSMERGYLLPIGCKDLIDAIRLQSEQPVELWGIRTFRKNESIKAPRVRVLKGEADLGILPLADALQLAKSLEVDLVELTPQADPPVCMLMDYPELIRMMSKRN